MMLAACPPGHLTWDITGAEAVIAAAATRE
jgi:hypothetical protein